MTLVAAGHETTAAAIAWACDLLAHHPAVAQRLRDADDREYLKATAKEVLRVRTVAYASAARVPLWPVRVGEWEIGPEAMILIDAQGIHADPELFPTLTSSGRSASSAASRTATATCRSAAARIAASAQAWRCSSSSC